MDRKTHPSKRICLALAVLGIACFVLSGLAPTYAQVLPRPSVGLKSPSSRPPLMKRIPRPVDPTAPRGLEDVRGAARPSEISTVQAKPQSANAWNSWSDLPRSAPSGGYLISKERAVGDLSPERFPGIVLGKNADVTGVPRSLDILNKLTNVAYKDAVRSLLIGPDRHIFGEYVKSPAGHYILELPPGKDIVGGRYEIRIVVDGDNAAVLREIPIVTESDAKSPPLSNPNHLKVYISKETIDRFTKSGYSPPRTTFETDVEGEKLLRAGISEIDRALVHYKEAYEALDSRSSYELRWKTTFNYAKALHDATLWHQYSYAADALRMFEAVRAEYEASKSKPFWKFWRATLKDIGIAEADIVEPLSDLRALDLQSLFARYSINGEPAAVEELSASLKEFAQRFAEDEAAFSKRLRINGKELTTDLLRTNLQRLLSALEKLAKPALVELDDGNFLVKEVAGAAGDPAYQRVVRAIEILSPSRAHIETSKTSPIDRVIEREQERERLRGR